VPPEATPGGRVPMGLSLGEWVAVLGGGGLLLALFAALQTCRGQGGSCSGSLGAAALMALIMGIGIAILMMRPKAQ
jgi:hypothetical protein